MDTISPVVNYIITDNEGNVLDWDPFSKLRSASVFPHLTDNAESSPMIGF